MSSQVTLAVPRNPRTFFMDEHLKLALDAHCDTLEAHATRAAELESQAQAQGIISAIDETVDILIRLKNQLTRSRNLMSAINRIPSEILTKIFLYAVPRASNCTSVIDPEPRPASGKLGVVAISHVCRRWRAIALSTPSLWIRYTPRTAALLSMFLSRSADIPMVLDIHYSRDHEPGDEYIQLLYDELPRAKGLYIDLDTTPDPGQYVLKWVVWEYIEIIQKLPPSLEHLHISAHQLDEDIDYFRDATRRNNLEWILGHMVEVPELPRLTHVFLHTVPIEWHSGLLRHLRALTLINSHIDPISLSCLSNIVIACPELEELTIHFIPWKHEQCDFEDQPICLPRLRLARITIDNHFCAQQLLCRMAFPSEARVWINVSESSTDQSIVATLVQVFASCFQKLQEPLGRLGITLAHRSAGVYGSVKNSTGALVLTIEDVSEYTPNVALSAFDSLLNQDLSHLTRFECNNQETERSRQCYSSEWWRQMFIKAPNIRSLAFRDENIASAAIHALISAEENDDIGTTSSATSMLPPLPDLTYIATSGLLSSNLLQQIQDEHQTIHQVQRLLGVRNSRIGCTKKLKAGWFSTFREPENFKELLDVNLHFVRDPYEFPLFLLDPRYWWDWELDLNETPDFLLD